MRPDYSVPTRPCGGELRHCASASTVLSPWHTGNFAGQKACGKVKDMHAIRLPRRTVARSHDPRGMRPQTRAPFAPVAPWTMLAACIGAATTCQRRPSTLSRSKEGRIAAGFRQRATDSCAGRPAKRLLQRLEGATEGCSSNDDSLGTQGRVGRYFLRSGGSSVSVLADAAIRVRKGARRALRRRVHLYRQAPDGLGRPIPAPVKRRAGCLSAYLGD
jgi:hypothetical protein